MRNGDREETDLLKFDMSIRDYTDAEDNMKKEWLKKNKVKTIKPKPMPKYPNTKMSIKNY